MDSKIVTISGKEYLARYPVGALILAEKKLGWNITRIEQKRADMSFEDICTIVRYGLHHTDGKLITDDEFSEILDTNGVDEFNTVVPDVLSVFSRDKKPASEQSTKN